MILALALNGISQTLSLTLTLTLSFPLTLTEGLDMVEARRRMADLWRRAYVLAGTPS